MRCLSNNFNVCSNSFAFFAMNEVVASISAENEEEESSAIVLASSRFSPFSSALTERRILRNSNRVAFLFLHEIRHRRIHPYLLVC